MLLKVVLGPVEIGILWDHLEGDEVLLNEVLEIVGVWRAVDVLKAALHDSAVRHQAQPARVLLSGLGEHALVDGGVVRGVEERLGSIEVQMLLVELLALALKYEEGRGGKGGDKVSEVESSSGKREEGGGPRDLPDCSARCEAPSLTFWSRLK